MKYIDADKLIVEINNRIMSVNLEESGNFWCHRVWAYKDVKDLIASLQQEQPEVDLEKEIRSERAILLDSFGPMNGEQSLAIRNFARHFYELGLNARKEE